MLVNFKKITSIGCVFLAITSSPLYAGSPDEVQTIEQEALKNEESPMGLEESTDEQMQNPFVINRLEPTEPKFKYLVFVAVTLALFAGGVAAVSANQGASAT